MTTVTPTAIVPVAEFDLLGTSPADLVPLDLIERGQVPVATPDEARTRASRIKAGLPTYVEIGMLIAEARAHRDWEALSYPTWFAYVTDEFGEILSQLDRRTRQEVTQDLHAHGMSTRQIAAAVGVDQKTVRNDLAEVRTKSSPDASPNGSPVSAVERPAEPEKVIGKDGKSYPAKKAAPKVEEKPAEPARPEEKPGYWSPEDRRKHEEEVQLQKDRESARVFAADIVTKVRTYTVTIITGYRLGERGLVTPEMIADLRKAIDNLEKEVVADAQR